VVVIMPITARTRSGAPLVHALLSGFDERAAVARAVAVLVVVYAVDMKADIHVQFILQSNIECLSLEHLDRGAQA
jgi:hypothetical protein